VPGAKADYGMIDISANGSSSNFSYSCTVSDVGGPGAATISVTPSGTGCALTGIVHGIDALQVTPVGTAPPVGCPYNSVNSSRVLLVDGTGFTGFGSAGQSPDGDNPGSCGYAGAASGASGYYFWTAFLA
jgi:hypothetical protein